jgi:hypothetical protein
LKSVQLCFEVGSVYISWKLVILIPQISQKKKLKYKTKGKRNKYFLLILLIGYIHLRHRKIWTFVTRNATLNGRDLSIHYKKYIQMYINKIYKKDRPKNILLSSIDQETATRFITENRVGFGLKFFLLWRSRLERCLIIWRRIAFNEILALATIVIDEWSK